MEDFFCQLTSSLIGGDVEQDHLGTEDNGKKETNGYCGGKYEVTMKYETVVDLTQPMIYFSSLFRY